MTSFDLPIAYVGSEMHRVGRKVNLRLSFLLIVPALFRQSLIHLPSININCVVVFCNGSVTFLKLRRGREESSEKRFLVEISKSISIYLYIILCLI